MSSQPYYQLGGNLPLNAPSYVRRVADTDLLTSLLAGKFCYVLTSRQMGKSSLMVQTARSLREHGAKVAVLDLTRIGQNLTPEQWYDGLLIPLGREFRLEDELDDFWNSDDPALSKLGPMQRWMMALRDVVLKSTTERIVIFVDEIDAVRGLSFSTDEFFAGIRQMYNERTLDPALERITFCLLGVAKPSDLIRNVNTTPFNIGHRIELSDFTEVEAPPLLGGLGHDDRTNARLLHRLLWWTGGHPYLTQRMCAAIAADPTVTTEKGVDRVCEEIFLSSRAREKDDNLLFVRERLLRSDVDRASLLDLYARIRAGKSVSDDDSSVLIDTLRLAGVVHVQGNRLLVRNRIYAHVFDKVWIRQNMPDAELRRQRRAFRQGLGIAAGLAAVVFAVIGTLYLALQAQVKERTIRTYASNMVQVQQDFDLGNFGDGTTLLKTWMERSEVTKGFEWNMLWARFGGESATTYYGHWRDVRSVAISPDEHGRYVATAGADSTVRIFDTQAASCAVTDAQGDREAAPATAPVSPSRHGCYVLVNALLIDTSRDATQSAARLVDAAGLKQLHCQAQPESCGDTGQSSGWLASTGAAISHAWHHFAYSFRQKPKLHEIASSSSKSASDDETALPRPGVLSVKFSPDGKWLAIATGAWGTTNAEGHVYLWDMQEPSHIVYVRTRHNKGIDNAVFLNNREFATASEDNSAEFYTISDDGRSAVEDPSRGYDLNVDKSIGRGINASAFSTEGSYYAMAFGDGTLVCKPLKSDTKPYRGIADVSGLMSAVFYDDSLLLVGTRDGAIKQVNCATHSITSLTSLNAGLVSSITLSKHKDDPRKDRLIATTSESTIQIYRIVRNKDGGVVVISRKSLRGHRAEVYSAAISPDDAFIVSGSADKSVRFWERQDPVYQIPDSKEDVALDPEASQSAADAASQSLDTTSYVSHADSFAETGAVSAIAFSPDGKQLVSLRGISTLPGENNHADLAFYDISEPSRRKWIVVRHHSATGLLLAFAPNGQKLATSAIVGNIALWDTKRVWTDPDYKPAELALPAQTRYILSLSFAADGTLMTSLSSDRFGRGGELVFWRPDANSPTGYGAAQTIPPENREDFARSLIAFDSKGKWLAVCTTDSSSNTVEVMDAAAVLRGESTKPVHVFGNETAQGMRVQGPCSALAFSPDSKWLIEGSSQREIAIWDTSNWQRLTGASYEVPSNGGIQRRYLEAPPLTESNINGFAFSPDSRILAYATQDAKILLWDIPNERPLPTITDHTGGVLSIAFSANGNCLASGSTDGTIHITPTAGDDLDSVTWVPFGSFWKPCYTPH